MHRRPWFLFVSVPLLAGLALFVPPLRGGDGGAARTTGSDDAIDEPAQADLVGVRARGSIDAARADGVQAPMAASGARVSAAIPAAEQDAHSGALDAFVMGVLTDAGGVPLPGRVVTLRNQEQLDFDIGEDDFDVRISSIDAFVLTLDPRSETTDATGAFVFEGSSRTNGGQLVFGGDILLGGPRSADVDQDADWQVLRLPRLERQGCVWTVDVVDREGRPLAIESVELELVGPPPFASSRAPFPNERIVSLGSIDQRGLPPGQWRMSVRPAGGITSSIESPFTATDAQVHSVLEVDVLEGTVADDVGSSVNDDGTTWVDPGSGLLEFLPENIVGVGDPALNRHFAQTLRVGHGPVKAAELTVGLRAMLHNAENDAIYLEYRGAKKYVWSARLSSVLGRPWKKGDATTLRLDLARLPGLEGPVDLRPYLEDGLLDVVVQDDTTIESISARVIR